MIENISENFRSRLENKEEITSEKLSKLSKQEIIILLDLDKDLKNETLNNIPNEVYWPKEINMAFSERSEFSVKYGYKVGKTNIKNKKTDEIIELNLYCKRNKTNYVPTANTNPAYESISYTYYLVDKNGKLAGTMDIKNFSSNLSKTLLENYSEVSLKKEYNLSKNLLKYGDDTNEEPRSFIHIDKMQSFKEGCGTALHEIAVEHSLRNGFEGRAQLYADYLGDSKSDNNVVTSAGFHENFGYFYKDVYNYNKNGELRHKGKEIHEALAKSRWEEAEKWKNDHPGEKMPEKINDNYRPLADKAALIAFLPKHVILREKERILKKQNLIVSLETLDALENSHKKE